ncbi:MAG: hypothetical protein ACI841_003034 [Planctomycetota bacterium]|jgi:hypothetical protein
MGWSGTTISGAWSNADHVRTRVGASDSERNLVVVDCAAGILHWATLDPEFATYLTDVGQSNSASAGIEDVLLID